jgi:hypothetical protein
LEIERSGISLYGRPKPTPGCSAAEKEEEEEVFLRSDAHTTVNIKLRMFWNLTPCSLDSINNRRTLETCCMHS